MSLMDITREEAVQQSKLQKPELSTFLPRGCLLPY